jgi:lysophospholipase L1-like esterase
MTRTRKLLFSLLTVGLVFALIEGTGQFIWWRLESERLQLQRQAGEKILRNDAISFMKVPDGIYGYALKPNFRRQVDYAPGGGEIVINPAGFHQRDVVPVARVDGRKRIVCLGESTTFGTTVDSNYPSFLRNIFLRNVAGEWRNAEVINAGVPGWISDQVALRVEYQLKAYKPDIAILYVGWNDFQSYSPMYDSPPATSYFEQQYKGKAWKQYAVSWLKSVALLSDWYHSRLAAQTSQAASPGGNTATSPDDYYRFLDASLDRIVGQFRSTNADTKVFVSTVVGRWPIGTPEEWARIPNIWWMQDNHLTREQSAMYVARFNDHLRRFARQRQLGVVDAAATFEHVDRAKLLWDWAHMTPDGYELVAWTMVDALRAQHILELSDESRFTELKTQYAVQ